MKTFLPVAGYGLAADEFPDNAHAPIHTDSIAMTDWPVDSVACPPRKAPGGNTGGILFLGEETRSAQVPYRSLLAHEVNNFLVPVALSVSHVGWGAIRLEPCWMQLGESAGFAAALAVKGRTTPAALDSDAFIRKLAASHMMISFFNDVDIASDDPRVAATQYFGTKGFLASYDAKLDTPLTERVKEAWQEGFVKLQAGKLEPCNSPRLFTPRNQRRRRTRKKHVAQRCW